MSITVCHVILCHSTLRLWCCVVVWGSLMLCFRICFTMLCCDFLLYDMPLYGTVWYMAWYGMVCNGMGRYGTSCNAMLCYDIWCYTLLYYALFYQIMLFHAMLHQFSLYYSMLCYITLCCVIFRSAVAMIYPRWRDSKWNRLFFNIFLPALYWLHRWAFEEPWSQ